MDDTAAQEETIRCLREVTEQAFRTMPEAALVRCLDAMAHTGGGHTHVASDYRNELTRRETERQSKRLEWLTWALVALTVVITVATVVLVWSELRSH
jgi:hypothetical protein